jgi:hypothetical protein
MSKRYLTKSSSTKTAYQVSQSTNLFQSTALGIDSSLTKILNFHSLYSRHLVKKVHQKPMKTSPAVVTIWLQTLNKFQQPRERAFFVHHLECDFILSTIEKEKGGNQMQRVGVIFLFPQATSVSLQGIKTRIPGTAERNVLAVSRR